MAGLEQTFTPRVVDIDHGETVFAVDYRQTFFRRNLRRPVLSTGSSVLVVPEAFTRFAPFALGQSLVADAVNQLLEHAADPVFAAVTFWGLGDEAGAALLEGSVQACREAGCALAPPRLIAAAPPQRGAAASAVGVAEQKRVIDARRVEAGDAVLGLAAGGFLPVDLEAAPEELNAVTGLPPAAPLARAVLQVVRRYRRYYPVHAGVVPGVRFWRGGRRDTPAGPVAAALRAKLPDELVFVPGPEPEDIPEELRPWWRGLEAAVSAERSGLALVLVVGERFARSIETQLRRRGVRTVRLGTVQSRTPPP
jgi:hypothetical protein